MQSKTPLIQFAQKAILPLFMAILFYAGDTIGVLKPLRSTIDTLVKPVAFSLTKARANIIEKYIVLTTIPSLAKQKVAYTSIQNDVLRLTTQIIEIQNENEALRNQLDMPKRKAQQLQIARVISLQDTMIIQVDTAKEVKRGTGVIMKDAYIGEVIAKRAPTIYEVLPITHPSFKAKVIVYHEGEKTEGILQGQFGTQMKLTKVLPTAVLGVDDIIALNDETRPQDVGLAVGKIAQVTKDETQVFKEASVVPLAPIHTLTSVLVEVGE